ncbi:hypothetical protein O181_125301 [Austropuccinia psidii MF-1]|uniref:Uncharacterized protein n=1 Tax=Austropuccinia psidii MF-1 TaxID=1389203 RepID=A0A9Q3KS33_9BASI|nr:hypothetical protein [Austropuccinia psidii MF-1]
MDFCTCPSCRKYKITLSNGKTCQGLYVNRSTQIRHWAKEAKKESSAIEHGVSNILLNRKHSSTSDVKEHTDQEEDDCNNESISQSKITSVILYFIMWLYLVCGISRENCHCARDMIVYLAQVVTQQDCSIKSQLSRVPYDIHTISKLLESEFEFERHVCCPQCYSLYNIELAPGECT